MLPSRWSRRGRRAARLALAVWFAFALAPDSSGSPPQTPTSNTVYRYEITTTETASADSFTDTRKPAWYDITGSLETSASITYDVAIRLNKAGQTVYMQPIGRITTTIYAKALSGTASLDLTATCDPASLNCTSGGPTHCAYSDLAINLGNTNASWRSTAGPDPSDRLTDEHGAYLVQKIRVELIVGYRASSPVVATCSPDANGPTGLTPPTISPNWDDFAGISWSSCTNWFDIPLDELGKTAITAPSEPPPTGCHTWPWNASFDPTVTRTTTLRLLSRPAPPVNAVKATIDWRMPPRLSSTLEYEWSDNRYGLPSHAYVDPEQWKVKLFLTHHGLPYCPSGAAYRWHISGNGVSDEVPGTGCSVMANVPTLGVYDVTATDLASGVVAENKDVIVRDWLLVGVGDSNGSGEGNPPWQFHQCDRSLASAQYRVAQFIEDHDPRSSVTFIFASCSGATVEHVWQLPYAGTQGSLGPPLPPQLTQVVQRVGNRPVDGVILSVGINNLRFGPLMGYCVDQLISLAPSECEPERVKATLDGQGYVDSYASGGAGDPTLRATTWAKVRALPSSYAALAQAFRARTSFSRADIFITEYPDFAHDQNGDLCTGETGPLPHFYPGTWSFLTNVNDTLNLMVDRTSADGWHPVLGIDDAFNRHGYCSTASYFLTIDESLWRQWDKYGSFHPTAEGQGLTYAATRDTVCVWLYGNRGCNGIPPWRP